MTSEADLDSDEQGEKGQSRFREICVDAKLTCNEAHRDRAGFDFVVNDRISVDQKSGLDSRNPPLSALIQTKCIKIHNSNVKLRLSSLEQIAKDPKPSFIYVFRLKEDGSFGTSVLIHIAGDVLGKVLKKLRSEEAAGRFAVNHAYMYLSMSNGLELEPTGDALRKHLADACGSDPGEYSTKKAIALKEIGFEGKPFNVKMNLELANVDEFLDVMLGLKSEVPAKIVAQAETRFGITLRREDLSNVAGSLTVQPQAAIKCTLVVRRGRFAEPIAVKGDIVMAPSLKNLKKAGGFLFRSKVLNFVGKMLDEKFSVNLNFIEFKDETQLAPSEWCQIFRIAQAISQKGFSIALEPAGAERFLLEDVNALITLDEDVVSFDIENAKRVVRLAEMAGALDEVQISFAELCQQADFISAGYSLLAGEEDASLLSFEVENISDVGKISELTEGYYINYFTCGPNVIVWSADVIFSRRTEGCVTTFQSEETTLREVIFLSRQSYAVYVSALRKTAEGRIIVDRALE